MKKLIIFIGLMFLIVGSVRAGNKGVFVKGYMNGYKIFKDLNVNMKDKTFTADKRLFVIQSDYNIGLLTIESSGNLIFCDVDGGQITMNSLLKCLRSIAPQHFDKKIAEIQGKAEKELKIDWGKKDWDGGYITVDGKGFGLREDGVVVWRKIKTKKLSGEK